MQNKKNYYLSMILICSLTRFALKADPFDQLDQLSAFPVYGGTLSSVVIQHEQSAFTNSWLRSVLQDYYISFLCYYCSVCSWVKRSCVRSDNAPSTR